MKKRSPKKQSGNRLATTKELDVLIKPVIQALDSISDGGGLSPEEYIQLQLFSGIALQLAQRRKKPVLEASAMRLSELVKRMVSEHGIDESDFDQIRADVFNLAVLIKGSPAVEVWGLLEKVAISE